MSTKFNSGEKMNFYNVIILLTAMMVSALVIADELVVETSQGKLLGITAGEGDNKINAKRQEVGLFCSVKQKKLNGSIRPKVEKKQ